jgi:hypothetical protein
MQCEGKVLRRIFFLMLKYEGCMFLLSHISLGTFQINYQDLVGNSQRKNGYEHCVPIQSNVARFQAVKLFSKGSS